MYVYVIFTMSCHTSFNRIKRGMLKKSLTKYIRLLSKTNWLIHGT